MAKVDDFPQVKSMVMIKHTVPGTREGRTNPAMCILINHPGFDPAPNEYKIIYVRGLKSQGNEILVDPTNVLSEDAKTNKWLNDYCSDWEGYVEFKCEDLEMAEKISPGFDEDPIWMTKKREFNSFGDWVYTYSDAKGYVFGSSYGGDGIQF